MHDQATELRQLVRRRPSIAGGATAAPLIVVSGAAPGVGTTTIAINLAVALARLGRRAVLVDADLERGGSACWDTDRHSGNVVDVLSGRRGVHEALSRGPLGVQVVAGARDIEIAPAFSAAAQVRLITQLQTLAPHAETVIVDAGSQRGPFARRFWQVADAVWIVTTPDDAAVLQCYATTKSLLAGESVRGPQVFVNRAEDRTRVEDVQQRLIAACHQFLGLRAGEAGSAPAVNASDWAQDPLFAANSPAARALENAAEQLWIQLQRSRRTPSESQVPKTTRMLAAAFDELRWPGVNRVQFAESEPVEERKTQPRASIGR